MIFVEFDSPNYPFAGAKHYFVGASLDEVLTDTKGGTGFGLAEFSSHREISEEQAHVLNLGYLENGVSSVKRGRCNSYKLGTPRGETI